MDLNPTRQERHFRGELRTWLESNTPRDWERHSGDSMEARFVFMRAWQRKVYDAGWAGLSWPSEYGGRGATLLEQAIFNEELARAAAPPLPGILGLELVGPTLIAFGTDKQKKRYLPKILSGEEIWCQGFSEPGAGSDLANLQTAAELQDGRFVVNGQKVWTSYGWAADWCELVVRTNPGAPKHKGLSVLLVDMHSPGVQVRPLRQMTGESEFSELFFDNVSVPAENLVGRLNDGWNVALGTLMHERALLGAGLQITFRRQFARLVELAREVERNGRPAAQDPAIRQKLAQCYAEIEIMRLNQMRVISRVMQTGMPGPEGSIQKIFWSELNQRFQQVAMEILGPYGQLTHGSEFAVDDGRWAYGYLRARGNTIEAGTSEIQRNIVGHFVLGLPKSY